MIAGRSTLSSAVWWLFVATLSGACSAPPAQPAAEPPKNLVLITIDTLRADHVGPYGYSRARTPNMNALALRGVKFEHAYATAPITLPSHASLMTGRYPPGHGARHNGMTMDPNVPTLATTLSSAGFATGGFVAAFPLDRRFGISKGFETYGDRMPRGPDGHPANDRPGREVVTEALAWLDGRRNQRVFLWVHLFEPHAPYGDARTRRSVVDRYDDDVAEADVQIGRLLAGLGTDLSNTVIVLASDHGEAFGEHGEIAHSLFVYDTTLHVPLVMAGPGIPTRSIDSRVALIDVVPTVLKLLGVSPIDTDGVDLSHAFARGSILLRDLYAESFAPLFDFGWSPLRSIRSGDFKFIEAPRAELYNLDHDPAEMRDLSRDDRPHVAELRTKTERYPAPPSATISQDREVLNRLQSLGYVGGGPRSSRERPDPKDRKTLAAEIAKVTSGELEGLQLEATLRRIVQENPENPQANLRLGYVLLESNHCAEALPLFKRAIAAHLPSVDAHLGVAQCQSLAQRLGDAQKTLVEAERLEPGNAVVAANLGIVLSDAGRHGDAIAALQRALTIDPEFHEARFNLARVLARAGRRADAAREAKELLARLPNTAPQRAEVERLLKAVE